MTKKETTPIYRKESFIAGTDGFSLVLDRSHKMKGGVIFFCRKGWAQITIDLKEYEIIQNSQVILIPGAITKISKISKNFSISYFTFSQEIFQEASLRLELSFFHFLKENPCYVLPQEHSQTINKLMIAAATIYNDQKNRFRNQIAKNLLQNFLLEVCDKCHDYFNHPPSRDNRKEKIFKSFMTLLHEYCITKREVVFYADQLCISTKYLTTVCQSSTGNSAKKIIDAFAIREIKTLLQSGELSIQEIADKLCFPDQSYLTRYFKRFEGISPKKYLQHAS